MIRWRWFVAIGIVIVLTPLILLVGVCLLIGHLGLGVLAAFLEPVINGLRNWVHQGRELDGQ